MKFATVGEIMIPLDKYPHLPHWFTLRQAIAEFENSELVIEGRRSLPRVALAFDEQYQLVGMVRRRDILRGLEPPVLLNLPLEERRRVVAKLDDEKTPVDGDQIVEEVRRQADRPIADIMVPVKATADFNDSIVNAVYDMNANKFSLLPVLKDGIVVGVVRTVDVLHKFAELVI